MKKKLGFAVLGAVVLTAASAAVALAAIPDSSGVIHGCYKGGGPLGNSGSLRVIDSPTQSCNNNETVLNWSQGLMAGAQPLAKQVEIAAGPNAPSTQTLLDIPGFGAMTYDPSQCQDYTDSGLATPREQYLNTTNQNVYISTGSSFFPIAPGGTRGFGIPTNGQIVVLTGGGSNVTSAHIQVNSGGELSADGTVTDRCYYSAQAAFIK